MLDRRQAITLLALACAGARAAPDELRQVPAPLSAALPGVLVLDGSRHQEISGRD